MDARSLFQSIEATLLVAASKGKEKMSLGKGVMAYE